MNTITTPSTTFFHNKGQLITEEVMREEHVFPVYDDYSAALTPIDGLNLMRELGVQTFGEVGQPEIRFTHEKKVRKHEARHKKASEISREDVNVYAERTAMVIPIPGYENAVNGFQGGLCMTAMKAYNLDSLTRSSNMQHWKFMIGYQMRVCMNLCMSVQGSKVDIKVKTADDLREQLSTIITNYDAEKDLEKFRNYNNYSLTENQYATIVGKMRMYQHLSKDRQEQVGDLVLADTLVTQATKEYMAGPFAENGSGEISLWQFYNQFTSGVKDSNMTEFLDRNLNCSQITDGIIETLDGKDNAYSWYLN